MDKGTTGVLGEAESAAEGRDGSAAFLSSSIELAAESDGSTGVMSSASFVQRQQWIRSGWQRELEHADDI